MRFGRIWCSWLPDPTSGCGAAAPDGNDAIKHLVELLARSKVFEADDPTCASRFAMQVVGL